jgi:hypothetical protein
MVYGPKRWALMRYLDDPACRWTITTTRSKSGPGRQRNRLFTGSWSRPVQG